MRINKKIFIGIVLMLLLVVAAGAIYYTREQKIWKDSANFSKYAEEFQAIAEFVLDTYPQETDKWLGVSVEDVDGRGIYDADKNDLVQCPKEVKEALNQICDFGFPSDTAILEAICIQNESVYFCITSEKYVLAYMPENEPMWIEELKENEKIRIKHIKGDWYHIVKEQTKR